jgi:hypothetical protein
MTPTGTWSNKISDEQRLPTLAAAREAVFAAADLPKELRMGKAEGFYYIYDGELPVLYRPTAEAAYTAAWQAAERERGDCPECGGTGEVDSGGSNPDGSWINVPCSTCGPASPPGEPSDEQLAAVAGYIADVTHDSPPVPSEPKTGTFYQLEIRGGDEHEGWRPLSIEVQDPGEPTAEWFAKASVYHVREDMRLVRITREVLHERSAPQPAEPAAPAAEPACNKPGCELCEEESKLRAAADPVEQHPFLGPLTFAGKSVEQGRELPDAIQELKAAYEHHEKIRLDTSKSQFIRENGRHGKTSPWAELCDAIKAVVGGNWRRAK